MGPISPDMLASLLRSSNRESDALDNEALRQLILNAGTSPSPNLQDAHGNAGGSPATFESGLSRSGLCGADLLRSSHASILGSPALSAPCVRGAASSDEIAIAFDRLRQEEDLLAVARLVQQRERDHQRISRSILLDEYLTSALLPNQMYSAPTAAPPSAALSNAAISAGLRAPGLAIQDTSNLSQGLMYQASSLSSLRAHGVPSSMLLSSPAPRIDPRTSNFSFQQQMGALKIPGAGHEMHADQAIKVTVDSKPQPVPSPRAKLPIKQNCANPGEASETLTLLGATQRSKSDPYIDASLIEDPFLNGGKTVASVGEGKVASATPSCGYNSFPNKVYRMLQEARDQDEESIVSFLPHGRGFLVHDVSRFVSEIMPRYFPGQKRWSSFGRQLNLYGFCRVTHGRDMGSYYHELFLDGHPNLCRYMRRVGVPKDAVDRRRVKLPTGDDPNFYAMPPVRPPVGDPTKAPAQNAACCIGSKKDVGVTAADRSESFASGGMASKHDE